MKRPFLLGKHWFYVLLIPEHPLRSCGTPRSYCELVRSSKLTYWARFPTANRTYELVDSASTATSHQSTHLPASPPSLLVRTCFLIGGFVYYFSLSPYSLVSQALVLFRPCLCDSCNRAPFLCVVRQRAIPIFLLGTGNNGFLVVVTIPKSFLR
jgi:hypothetical protein